MTIVSSPRSEVRDRIDAYIAQHVDKYVEQLALLCGQPSVSATGEGIAQCAQLVGETIDGYGLGADLLPTDGNPVVLGESDGQQDKTLLFYLHYDVQPPEPLSLWHSPPFALARRDGKLFARGAADDKGHIVARLAAVDAVRHALGELPCKVMFFVEGEEELGSPNLVHCLEANAERLAADGCLWEYGSVNLQGAPVQYLGMRGIYYVNLAVKTAGRDAHSGLGGSIFPNAAWRLVWALASLKDADERIRIPGFYDNVRPPSKKDLALLAELPDESAALKEMFGLSGFVAGLDGGLTFKQASIFEPTCTVCGLEAGYQGPGTKTVIPAEARAKVDFRLVPEQTPDEIAQKLRAHLDAEGFEDVMIESANGLRPARSDPDHPFVKLAHATGAAVYGQQPVVAPMSGGSGPMEPFIRLLDLPVVAAGVAYPESHAHSPNENIRLVDFINGIRHTAYIIEAFGRNSN